MSALAASSFNQPMTHTNALYFTVTVFATVGFGDITAKPKRRGCWSPGKWNQTIVRCTTRPAPRGVRFTPSLPCTNPCIKPPCPIALMHAFDAHSVAWIQ